MNDILKFFQNGNGYARMKDLKQAGFHTRKIKDMLNTGIIEKIKPGLYRLNDSSVRKDFYQDFVDACRLIPKGVVCLISALEYHNLTAVNPYKIYIAIPNKSKPQTIHYPPVEFYYFRESSYSFDIETVSVRKDSFRVYGREKTICDMFRFRDRLGEDIALEALNNYLKLESADLNKLRSYAVNCRVKSVILPYLKALSL